MAGTWCATMSVKISEERGLVGEPVGRAGWERFGFMVVE
jgi:hypothetical protein